jgi:CheY-like chemotaxis protein
LRRNGRLPAMPHVATATAPQRHFPRIALADDPPRGRILVVTDQGPLALEVQRLLREAGYHAVGPADSADEADRLIERRPLDGAVVDRQLAGGAAAVADRLVHEGIPVVWLTAQPTEGAIDAFPPAADGAPAVSTSVLGEELIPALERALSSGTRSGRNSLYPVPPPQQAWPRVFPQL